MTDPCGHDDCTQEPDVTERATQAYHARICHCGKLKNHDESVRLNFRSIAEGILADAFRANDQICYCGRPNSHCPNWQRCIRFAEDRQPDEEHQ
jgi:hypothetical protein